MRQSRFTETQIVSILKESDAGRPVNELWRQHGISSATYYKWKAKYGGLEASEVKQLKELEQENSRLKRMYAEPVAGECGAQGCHRKKALRPAERREVVTHLVTVNGPPVQRACRVVSMGRATYYRPLMDWARRDAPVIAALTTLVEESLGLLEVLRSAAARWAPLESQTAVAGLLPASLEFPTTDEEAAPPSAASAARGGAPAQCRVGR